MATAPIVRRVLPALTPAPSTLAPLPQADDKAKLDWLPLNGEDYEGSLDVQGAITDAQEAFDAYAEYQAAMVAKLRAHFAPHTPPGKELIAFRKGNGQCIMAFAPIKANRSGAKAKGVAEWLAKARG